MSEDLQKMGKFDFVGTLVQYGSLTDTFCFIRAQCAMGKHCCLLLTYLKGKYLQMRQTYF